MNNGDFYLRKFTASGAVDTSFGTNGFVRTSFHNRFDGAFGTDLPKVLKVQPDGKILFGGYCTTLEPGAFPAAAFGPDACLVRYNANGSLDTTFGSNGIARWTAPECPANCFPPRRFQAVRLQPDGRIVAVGFDSRTVCSGAAAGNRFAVTRWTFGGQLETVRYLDNVTAYNFQDERAVAVHLTRDTSKILVSGSFKNLSGTPAGRQKPTLARFNVADLSLDQTFGGGGIAQLNVASDSSVFSTFYLKAIEPDGRIVGIDDGQNSGYAIRLNPDGSPDLSFGNLGIDGNGRGRLRVNVTNFNGHVSPFFPGQILVRPNGRINLVG